MPRLLPQSPGRSEIRPPRLIQRSRRRILPARQGREVHRRAGGKVALGSDIPLRLPTLDNRCRAGLRKSLIDRRKGAGSTRIPRAPTTFSTHTGVESGCAPSLPRPRTEQPFAGGSWSPRLVPQLLHDVLSLLRSPTHPRIRDIAGGNHSCACRIFECHHGISRRGVLLLQFVRRRPRKKRHPGRHRLRRTLRLSSCGRWPGSRCRRRGLFLRFASSIISLSLSFPCPYHSLSFRPRRGLSCGQWKTPSKP